MNKVTIVFVIGMLVILNQIAPKPFKQLDKVECVNIK
tara:strand:- start:456 stop:566 length:111 start_codon:yes stop_codon:yes gene_type:complete